MTTPYIDPQTIHNPSTGAAPPAAWGDTVRDALELLVRMPGCVLRGATTTNAASATWNNVAWNAPVDLRDTDGYHTGTSDVIQIPTGLGGWYDVSGQAAFGANISGARLVRYSINGAGDNRLAQVTPAGSGFGTAVPFTTCVRLNAGDALRLSVYQDSGATLTIGGTASLIAVRLVALA
jgi:hypothetical protein